MPHQKPAVLLDVRPLLRELPLKTALYFVNRTLQVVLTPEDDFEKQALKLVEKRDIVQMYRGSFYECRGGWFRHETRASGLMGEGGHTDDDSLILVLTEPKGERA